MVMTPLHQKAPLSVIIFLAKKKFLVLQALQIKSFAGHNSLRKTVNLIQNLHFLGLSSYFLQGGALLLSECLCDLLFL